MIHLGEYPFFEKTSVKTKEGWVGGSVELDELKRQTHLVHPFPLHTIDLRNNYRLVVRYKTGQKKIIPRELTGISFFEKMHTLA